MRKILTQEQKQQIIQSYQSGKGSDTVAKEFDIHPNTVLKLLKQNNIVARPFKRKIEISEFINIVELYKSGKSAQYIADKYDVTHNIILRILEKQGCPRRDVDDTHRIYPIREDYFNIIDTQEKAYILGFTFADGHNSANINSIVYDLAEKDTDILHKISNEIYLENHKDRVRHYKRERIVNGEKKTFKSAVLSFNSKHMCNVLTKLGCTPKKSLTVKFPEWLVDSELQRHFIRGYYDGDGGVYVPDATKKETGAIAKIIGTNSFIADMNNIIIKELKINIYLEYISDVLKRSSISGNQQVKTFLDWIYKDSTIHLDRKYNLYQELLKNMESNPRTRKN